MVDGCMTDKKTSTTDKGNDKKKCSFCGKSEKEVKKIILVGANQKAICNECIVTCTQIIKDTL